MGTASTGPDRRHFWERTVLGWHLVFAAMIVVVAAAAVMSTDVSSDRQWTALGLCLTWVVWYVALGAPSLMVDGTPWRARAYVVSAVLLASGIAWFVPEISWSSFILIPQIFALLNRIGEAIVAVAVLMIGYAGALIIPGEVTGSQR